MRVRLPRFVLVAFLLLAKAHAGHEVPTGHVKSGAFFGISVKRATAHRQKLGATCWVERALPVIAGEISWIE